MRWPDALGVRLPGLSGVSRPLPTSREETTHPDQAARLPEPTTRQARGSHAIDHSRCRIAGAPHLEKVTWVTPLGVVTDSTR